MKKGTKHLLFNDNVQENDKLRRYKPKTDFEDPYIFLFIFQ